MTAEEKLEIERIALENERLALEIERKKNWTHWSWLCFPAMWGIYFIIQQLLHVIR